MRAKNYSNEALLNVPSQVIDQEILGAIVVPVTTLPLFITFQLLPTLTSDSW
jgi:hypothetical protein